MPDRTATFVRPMPEPWIEAGLYELNEPMFVNENHVIASLGDPMIHQGCSIFRSTNDGEVINWVPIAQVREPSFVEAFKRIGYIVVYPSEKQRDSCSQSAA